MVISCFIRSIGSAVVLSNSIKSESEKDCNVDGSEKLYQWWVGHLMFTDDELVARVLKCIRSRRDGRRKLISQSWKLFKGIICLVTRFFIF